MVGYLVLNKNKVGAVSTWSGYESGYAEVRYTTPTWGGAKVTVSVPAEMEGATFNSATLSYRVSSASGSRYVRFNGESVDVTNARILSRLISGGNLDLYFSFKATGGTDGEGSHSAYCQWSNLSIAVDYTPATGLAGTLTVGSAGTAIYSVERPSLAYGETMTLGLTVRPTVAITKVTTTIWPGELETGVTYETERSVSANAGASLTYALAIPEDVYAAMTQRVCAAQIQITYTGKTGATYTTGRVACASTDDEKALKLLKQRSLPQITDIVWGESGTTHLTTYGNLIAGLTVPTVAFAVALDTEADSGIGYESRTVTLDARTYTLSGNGGTLDAVTQSGSVDYSITVTDSYGKSATVSSVVTVLAYTPPTLKGVAISRYTSALDSTGATVYELDDDGTSVWLDAEVRCQVALGTGSNPWTLTVTPPSGDTIVVEQGCTQPAKTYEADRTAITGSYANTSDYAFAVILSDSFTAVVLPLTVPKAGGIFNIERTGVAAGMRSGGTAEQPLTESAYPAHFYAGVWGADGKRIDDDTGWQELTLEAGVTAHDATFAVTPRYRRIGKHVYVRGHVNTSVPSGGRLIAVLPEGFRVPEGTHYDFAECGGQRIGRIYTDSNGKIRVEWIYGIGGGAYTSALWIQIDIDFLID